MPNSLINRKVVLRRSITPDPEDLVINQQFSRIGSLSDYTVTSPGSTWALSGGYLNITHSPGSGTFANYAVYNAYGDTQLELAEHIVQFIPRDNLATNAGFGVGIQETNTFGTTQSIYAVMRTDQTAANGKVRIYYDSTSKAESAAITWNVDDLIQVRLVRNKFAYTAYIKNVTQASAEISVTWNADASGSNDTQRIGRPVIMSLGGNVSVASYQYYSDVKFGAKFAFIGDSISHATQSLVTTNIPLRFADIATQGLADSADCTVYASSNNTTQEILNNIAEIINQRPQYAVLMIGGNDVDLLVAQATYEANYTSIRNQFVAAGITVIHCYNTPRDADDMSTLNTFIATFGPTDLVIDTFTPLKGAGTDLIAKYDYDTVHPNILGHARLGLTIYNEIKSLYTYSYHADTAAWLARTVGTFTDAEKFHYDYLIRQANVTGQWDYIELLQIYAQNNATDAVKNLISATPSGTLTNAPTFTADTGYAFNGTTQWIDTGFNLSTATLYTQNSGYLAVYVRTTGSSGEGCDLGAFDATPGNRSHLFTRYTTGTKWTAAVNTGSPTDDNTKGAGLYQVKRTGASALSLRFDSNTTTYSGSLSDASVTRPNCTLGVGCRNRATGGVVNYSDRPVALVASGSGSIDLGIMSYLYRVFLDFKGAGV